MGTSPCTGGSAACRSARQARLGSVEWYLSVAHVASDVVYFANCPGSQVLAYDVRHRSPALGQRYHDPRWRVRRPTVVNGMLLVGAWDGVSTRIR